MNIYQILHITEKEMMELDPDAKGQPKYYCVSKTGWIRFHPKLDPSKYLLFAQEGK